MPGMGPPPNPNARRRNIRAVRATQLPAEGRRGRPPAWPLPPNLRMLAERAVAQHTVDQLGDREGLTGIETRKLNRALGELAVLDEQAKHVEAAEAALWRDLWKLPQAVAWSRLKWTREVAQYVRWKVLGEWGDMDAAKEARQLADRLGLTPMAMLRLQWEIARDETGEQRETRQARAASTASTPARLRLKVVDETG